MNREIKFRAWDKERKYMNIWETVLHNFRMDEFFTPVDSFVLMQFTGLKDKNGVEIYEGDIISVFNWQTGTVAPPRAIKWNDRTARYNGLVRGDMRELEVIGNIYENPDLLKEAA